MQELNDILNEAQQKKKIIHNKIAQCLQNNDRIAQVLVTQAKEDLNVKVKQAHKNQVQIDKLISEQK